MVAAYIEHLQHTHAKPSVKQHLATIRMLFDWLVTGQVVDANPAHAVRGPKHVVSQGQDAGPRPPRKPSSSSTASRSRVGDKARTRPTTTASPDLIGLRDRALIAAMFFTFARVGAVVAMSVEDYYPQGKRWLAPAPGERRQATRHARPSYPGRLSRRVRESRRASPSDRKGPLFRTAPGTGSELTRNPLRTADVWRMIRRRAKQTGIRTEIGCHSFRATGITNYLEHDGTLEKAQQMASHASPRTTKLYDRTNDQITLDEVEKIRLSTRPSIACSEAALSNPVDISRGLYPPKLQGQAGDQRISHPLDNYLGTDPIHSIVRPFRDLLHGSQAHLRLGIRSTMRRRARQILLASLVALYGAMTVGGPALHALSSTGHAKVGRSADADGPGSPISSHHDCPICHFLAQGQLGAASTHVLSMDVVRIKPADDLPLTFPAAVVRPSGPRAPPLA